MFWIKLLITLIDIFFIYNGARLILSTSGKVLDLAAGHKMTIKKWMVATLLIDIGILLLVMVYPLSHMLTGNSPIDPVITGASIMLSCFLYEQDLL